MIPPSGVCLQSSDGLGASAPLGSRVSIGLVDLELGRILVEIVTPLGKQNFDKNKAN